MLPLGWVAVVTGLWIGSTRIRDFSVVLALAIAAATLLGLLMLLGNAGPNEVFVLHPRKLQQSFRTSGYYHFGAPAAIVITFLRYLQPQFFEGKLSKWWPLAVILLSGKPILFICHLSINGYDYLIFAARLAVPVALCWALWIFIAGFLREVCNSSPLFHTIPSDLDGNFQSTPTVKSPLRPVPGQFLSTPTSSEPPLSASDSTAIQSHAAKHTILFGRPRERSTSISSNTEYSLSPAKRIRLHSPRPSHEIQPQCNRGRGRQQRVNSRLQAVNTVRPRDRTADSRRRAAPTNASHVNVSGKTRGELHQAYLRAENDGFNTSASPKGAVGATPVAATETNHNAKQSPTHAIRTGFAALHLSSNNRYVASMESRNKAEDQNKIAGQRRLERVERADEKSWRRVIIEELRSIDALLPMFQHKLLILQKEPQKRYADGVNQCKDLWLDVCEKAIVPLGQLEFAENDPLAPYYCVILDEMVTIQAELQRLKSLPLVEAQQEDAKTPKTPAVPQSAMSVDNDDTGPQEESEASSQLNAVGTELKKRWNRAQKALEIMQSPTEEPYRLSMLMARCYADINFANSALQQLNDLELYIDGNLEETRKSLVMMAKQTIAVCEYLTKDGAGRPGLPLYDDMPHTFTDQPDDQANRIAVLLQNIRKECLLWTTGSERQPAGNMKLRVKWACKWIVQGSELADKLSETADEDLRRLPHTIFDLVMPMVRDVIGCLKHHEVDQKEITNSGLPHAKNIDIQLDILDRRKRLVERRQEGRRVAIVGD